MADAKTVEQHWDDWAEKKWPDDNDRRRNAWVLAVVRARKKWGIGKEVTAEDFHKAAEEALGIKIGGGPPPPAKASTP